MEVTETVEIPCDLCGAADPKFILMENGYRVCRCSRCTLTYVNPQPRLALGEDVGHFGDTEWSRGAEQTARESADLWETGLSRLTRHAGNQGRLLDVGCGHGFFLRTASSAGWEAHGIDVSEHALAYGRNRLDLQHMTRGDFLQSGFPDGHFDAVTLWNSLEHVASPSATVAEAVRVLRPGGVLMVRVPNIDFSRLLWRFRPLLSLVGMGHWSYLMTPPPQHLFGFSRKTIRALLEKHGFEVLEVSPAGVKVGSYDRVSWRAGLAARMAAVAQRLVHVLSAGRLSLAGTLHAFGRAPSPGGVKTGNR